VDFLFSPHTIALPPSTQLSSPIRVCFQLLLYLICKITFSSTPAAAGPDLFQAAIFDVPVQLYSHSYLCFGLNTAIQRLQVRLHRFLPSLACVERATVVVGLDGEVVRLHLIVLGLA
jgi:hypothetical protein